jgi:NAD(P)H dehydrogenase (quinone)
MKMPLGRKDYTLQSWPEIGAQIMTVSVILAHPNPGSYNHAIAKVALEALQRNGHEVAFHDLYLEKFDPVLPFREIPKGAAIDAAIQRHCDEISRAAGIIVIHPNWWGMPPAILKGWVDRVIRPGVAYEFLEGDGGEGVPCGRLMAKTALVFNTSNTYPEREFLAFSDPLETLWKNCIFGLCGVNGFYRKTYSVVVTSTFEQRLAWLEETSGTVNRYFPKD